MNQSPEDYRQLINRCVSGDRKASEAFIRQFSDLIYRSIKHTLLTRGVPFNTQDLEDLHNTVFLKLFEQDCKKLSQYRGINGCSLGSWLRVVIARIVLNQLRKKGFDYIGSRIKRVSIEDMQEIQGNEEHAWSALEMEEQERLLHEGIQTLSPRDRLFMKLYFEKEFSPEEIAEKMQLSMENFYTIKHRAIKRLRDYVSSETKC